MLDCVKLGLKLQVPLINKVVLFVRIEDIVQILVEVVGSSVKLLGLVLFELRAQAEMTGVVGVARGSGLGGLD